MSEEDDDLTDEPVSPFRDDAWIREPIADIKKRESEEMPSWFIPGLVGTLAWMGLFVWLAYQTNWPEAYGYRGICVRRGCLIEAVIRSPVLLQHPTPYSVALFAWFAATAAAIAGAVLYCTKRNPSRRSFLLLALTAVLILILALLPNSQWDL